jgi:hypothetical protein
LAQRLTDPHPSPSLATATKKRSAKLHLPDSKRGLRSPALRARPRFPSQAGTSCEAGASTARTRDGQPSPSGVHAGVGFGESGGVDAGLSLREPPSGPSTRFPRLRKRPHRESALTAPRPSKARNVPARSYSGSKARPAQPTVPLAHWQSLASQVPKPPGSHPGSLLHFTSAHPPCSRKGPHLPACRHKCPRRVKRETTNSRFSLGRDLAKI